MNSNNFKIQAHTKLPSSFGDFTLYAFSESANDPQPHLAMVHASMNPENTVAVRFHSECLTGDILGSKRCDCGEQLHESLHIIEKEGGALLYLRQEGRGIGLINKLKAYELQDEGMDTVDANVHLGFAPDERDFAVAIKMLELLKISAIKLITNNPLKLKALEGSSIEFKGRIPLIINANDTNAGYLNTKAKRMGHLFQKL